MACNTGGNRIVKMGIDYGTVQLLSTGTIDSLYKSELEGKDIALTVKSFIAHTPMVNNFVIQQLQELAQQNVCVLFTHSFGVKVVSSILNNTPINWTVVCNDRDAYIAAEQNFPSATIHFFADDQQLAYNVSTIIGEDRKIVLLGNNKVPSYFAMYFKGVDIDLIEIMVYQSAIKSIPIDENYHGIIFLDEMSVDSFFVLNDIPHNTVAFCVNESVANHLTKQLNKPTVIVQAAQNTMLSMLESIIVYYNR